MLIAELFLKSITVTVGIIFGLFISLVVISLVLKLITLVFKKK